MGIPYKERRREEEGLGFPAFALDKTKINWDP